MGLGSDIRERRERHTLVDFVVVIGPWDEGGPIVIGAVEESTYDALLEEGAWEARKAEWHSKLGMSEEVPLDSLRDVKVTAWLPWLWEMPEVRAEGAQEIPPEGKP